MKNALMKKRTLIKEMAATVLSSLLLSRTSGNDFIMMRRRVLGIALSLSVLSVIATNNSIYGQSAKDDAIIYQKIDALLKQMTLEEKVGMLHANSSFTSAGVKRLNIPELVTSDG